MLENTLYGLLSSMDNGELVLPAMQRPFVWKEDRLYRLMDSLLRGFPIGAVMLWKTTTAQRFRSFPKNIDNNVEQVFTFETSTNNSNKYLVLDGQQRLTSLYCMFKGTYNNKLLYVNILSGDSEDKDPGNEYYECQFLTEIEAQKINKEQTNVYFLSAKELVQINPIHAAQRAYQKATELNVEGDLAGKIANVYIRCASILGNSKSLQIIVVDEDQQQPTPLEEILEIFVRVNSGGLVLQKSDLLMSLLDLTWNDIQPELQNIVRNINKDNPYKISRDDVLKSLLLAEGAETRFDRLVSDRAKVENLSEKLPVHVAGIENAWKILLVILKDKCKIYSERFLRGGHNSLLPFVIYIYKNPVLSDSEKKKIAFAIYITLISGIFGSAESRMNSFTRRQIKGNISFPLEELIELVKTKYGVTSLDSLMRHSLDLALNLAHGGISINNNPDELQRDHIFPRSKRLAEKFHPDKVNHYANFHFLRGGDNLNKLDIEPDIWFKNNGYNDSDLMERLLTWDDIKPGNFLNMIEKRGQKIRDKACGIFGYAEDEINKMFIS
jgi:hypothetical protein